MNEKIYNIKSNLKDYNFYSNFIYKSWFFEIGAIDKDIDSFLGVGIHRTPADDGNELNAKQRYFHITKNFKNGVKLQLSVDDIDYKQDFKDLNGILVFGLRQPATDYTISFDDNIYSVTLEKSIKSDKNRLFIGGFYKYKTIDEKSFCYNF